MKWIECFLTNHFQTVIVNGTKSTPVRVISGVPQGSVLGPLIFLILIADIDQDVKHSILKTFVDDTRLTKEIKDKIDTILLQEDLNATYHWAKTNNMEFNNLKFELLRYEKDEEIKLSTDYLSNTGTKIKQKNEVRDLGITLTNNASFTSHINTITEKAKQNSAWALRTFKFGERLPMLTIWKSLILPTLEYSSQL